MSEIDPTLALALWNGLFVHKDTTQDVRAKIIEVAKATMASERAQKLAAETGAQVYWQSPTESATRIEVDGGKLGTINGLLE